MTWLRIYPKRPLGDLHILPVADVRAHEVTRECWCKPLVLPGKIIAHNALDGRELVEQHGVN